MRDSIHVTSVETLAEALAMTLRDTSLENGRLHFGDARPGGIGDAAH